MFLELCWSVYILTFWGFFIFLMLKSLVVVYMWDLGVRVHGHFEMVYYSELLLFGFEVIYYIIIKWRESCVLRFSFWKSCFCCFINCSFLVLTYDLANENYGRKPHVKIYFELIIITFRTWVFLHNLVHVSHIVILSFTCNLSMRF